MVVTREKCTIVYNNLSCHSNYILLVTIIYILIRSFTPTRVRLFLAISDGGPL